MLARRPCIEVDTGASGKTCNPIELFAHMVRTKYGGTDESEDFNIRLLDSLIKRGQIPMSGIVWHGERVSKIYGFRVGNGGKIEYDSPSRRPQRRAVKAHAPLEVPSIDLVTLRDAIFMSKQMAI